MPAPSSSSSPSSNSVNKMDNNAPTSSLEGLGLQSNLSSSFFSLTSPLSPVHTPFSPTTPLLDASSLSFNRNDILAPDFSPKEFIKQRRDLSLDRVKLELQSHLKELKNQLVELINRDYADFISLSTNLVGVDKMIQDLEKPLTTMKNDVMTIREDLQDVVSNLETKLIQRATIREKKAALQLLMSIDESMTKVEELLGIASTRESILGIEDSKANNTSAATKSDGKFIERVAIEYNQLQFLVEKGKDLPFVVNIDWRISRIRDTLTLELERSLKSAIEIMLQDYKNESAINSFTQNLRTYVLIGRIDEAEEVFKDTAVTPFIKKIFSKDSATPSPTHSSTSFNSSVILSNAYDEMVKYASEILVHIIKLSRKILRGTGRDFLLDVVFRDMVTGVSSAGLFAVGIPSEFHTNYQTTISFIQRFESLCSTVADIHRLRSSPAYIDFMKKWQLPVYFQLRFKEIATKYEESLSVDLGNGTIINGFTLEPSRQLIIALETMWSDSVFLFGLCYRFWRFTLQIIGRYEGWIQSVVENGGIRPSEPIENVTGSSSPPQSQRASTSSKTNTTQSRSSDTTDSDEANLKLYLWIHYDLRHIGERIKTFYQQVIIKKLNGGVKGVEDSLDVALNGVTSLFHDISNKITGILIKRGIEGLKMNRNIPGQYRKTNRDIPSKCSTFIPSLLQPIRYFMSTPEPYLPPSPIPQEWCKLAGETIASKYALSTIELMTFLKKTEDSLKRLKKVKKLSGEDLDGGGGRGGVSDEDKIRLQFYFDVQQLGRELKDLDIQPDKLEFWKELVATVEPASAILDQQQ